VLDAKSHVWHSKLLVNRQVSNMDGCKKFTMLANATLPSLSSLFFHKLCTLLYAIVIVKGVLKIHTVRGIRGPNFREKNKCPCIILTSTFQKSKMVMWGLQQRCW